MLESDENITENGNSEPVSENIPIEEVDKAESAPVDEQSSEAGAQEPLPKWKQWMQVLYIYFA